MNKISNIICMGILFLCFCNPLYYLFAQKRNVLCDDKYLLYSLALNKIYNKYFIKYNNDCLNSNIKYCISNVFMDSTLHYKYILKKTLNKTTPFFFHKANNIFKPIYWSENIIKDSFSLCFNYSFFKYDSLILKGISFNNLRKNSNLDGYPTQLIQLPCIIYNRTKSKAIVYVYARLAQYDLERGDGAVYCTYLKKIKSKWEIKSIRIVTRLW